MLNGAKAKLHITSRQLQTSLAASVVNVHGSTIRRKLNRYNIPWRATRRKVLLSTKNSVACLKVLPGNSWRNQRAFCELFLQTNESKIYLIGHNQICHFKEMPTKKKKLNSMKHVVGWKYQDLELLFSLWKQNKLHIIQANMNSQSLLSANLLISIFHYLSGS